MAKKVYQVEYNGKTFEVESGEDEEDFSNFDPAVFGQLSGKPTLMNRDKGPSDVNALTNISRPEAVWPMVGAGLGAATGGLPGAAISGLTTHGPIDALQNAVGGGALKALNMGRLFKVPASTAGQLASGFGKNFGASEAGEAARSMATGEDMNHVTSGLSGLIGAMGIRGNTKINKANQQLTAIDEVKTGESFLERSRASLKTALDELEDATTRRDLAKVTEAKTAADRNKFLSFPVKQDSTGTKFQYRNPETGAFMSFMSEKEAEKFARKYYRQQKSLATSERLKATEEVIPLRGEARKATRELSVEEKALEKAKSELEQPQSTLFGMNKKYIPAFIARDVTTALTGSPTAGKLAEGVSFLAPNPSIKNPKTVDELQKYYLNLLKRGNRQRNFGNVGPFIHETE
jgi:hypothetical protein